VRCVCNGAAPSSCLVGLCLGVFGAVPCLAASECVYNHHPIYFSLPFRALYLPATLEPANKMVATQHLPSFDYPIKKTGHELPILPVEVNVLHRTLRAVTAQQNGRYSREFMCAAFLMCVPDNHLTITSTQRMSSCLFDPRRLEPGNHRLCFTLDRVDAS
jgi:hypothetical protein